jgi:hypothetical protein
MRTITTVLALAALSLAFCGVAVALDVRCSPNADPCLGSKGPDTLTGTPKDDRIRALAGNDVVYGLAGRDFISGGEGAEHIWGGAGRSEIHAGRGNDQVNIRNGKRDKLVFCGLGENDEVIADPEDRPIISKTCETKQFSKAR